jgi:hypothetical protein
VWKKLYDSKKTLAGSLIEALGQLGIIESIKKDKVAFKAGKMKMVIPFSKLSKRQQAKLLKFAAQKVKGENASFNYFLFAANFKQAKRELETGKEKERLSIIAEQYFKYVLKKGSKEERSRIKKRYSRWSEYKKALK